MCLFLTATTTRAGTIDPNTPDAKHVAYGKDFHYVGEFCVIDKKGQVGFGSCVAIRPKTVLTAAHVIHDSLLCRVNINGKDIKVVKTETPTTFVYNGKMGSDIAICFVEEDMGLEFYPELYEKDDEIGRISSISGFGMHGTFATGAIKSDDKRRAGSNIIDKAYGDLLIVTPSSIRKTELEFCITPGDSGGGMFIDNKVAGINCCVLHSKGQDKPLGQYGHESAHTRISHHKKWIQETVELYESGFHGNAFIVEGKH